MQKTNKKPPNMPATSTAQAIHERQTQANMHIIWDSRLLLTQTRQYRLPSTAVPTTPPPIASVATGTASNQPGYCWLVRQPSHNEWVSQPVRLHHQHTQRSAAAFILGQLATSLPFIDPGVQTFTRLKAPSSHVTNHQPCGYQVHLDRSQQVTTASHRR